jgi:hypothetical protein
VIFITAYPERFLTGERPEPAFLIAKPFQPANVSAVISQALFFQQSARAARRAPRPDDRPEKSGSETDPLKVIRPMHKGNAGGQVAGYS